MDWYSLVGGAALGGTISWFVTWWYYRKSLNEQKKLRQEDQERRQAEIAAEYEQRAYEKQRDSLYRVRESAFNEYARSQNKRWGLAVNQDESITLVNLGGDISQFVEFSILNPGPHSKSTSFMRLNRLDNGESFTFSLPHGLNEVDGLKISAFRDSSYPDQDEVPIHPKYTMYEYRDPRL